MTPLDRVLDALRASGFEPHPSGGGWACRCPAHDDRAPSLSIATGEDGRALLKCHAGCSTEAVAARLGLTLGDLFVPRDGCDMRHIPGNPSHVACVARPRRTFATLDLALAAACPRGHRHVATWTYRNAAGESVLHVARYDSLADPAPGERREKTFRPFHVVEGGVALGSPRAPLALYRLPELLSAPKCATIHVTEGEKAADALASLGLVATTTAHGADGARRTDFGPLAGRRVAIHPDHDPAGERYAETVASLLRLLRPPARVLVVRLPRLPPKGDAVEYVAACRDVGAPDPEIRENLALLFEAAAGEEAEALVADVEAEGGRVRLAAGGVVVEPPDLLDLDLAGRILASGRELTALLRAREETPTPACILFAVPREGREPWIVRACMEPGHVHARDGRAIVFGPRECDAILDWSRRNSVRKLDPITAGIALNLALHFGGSLASEGAIGEPPLAARGGRS